MASLALVITSLHATRSYAETKTTAYIKRQTVAKKRSRAVLSAQTKKTVAVRPLPNKITSIEKSPTTSVPSEKLLWSETFDGTSLNASRWNTANPQTPVYNDEAQVYQNSTNNVRLAGGNLVLEAQKQGNGYTSGKIDTAGKQTVSVGSRLEARIKLPSGKGVWPAFWLMSDNQPHTSKLNPSTADWEGERFYMWDGEVDIMEFYGTYPGVVEATLHTFDTSIEKQQNNINTSEFHTYWMEWTADKLTMGVDGTTYFTQLKNGKGPSSWPLTNDNKYYVILNLAMGGSGGGTIVQSPSDNWKMEVDYVKCFKL